MDREYSPTRQIYKKYIIDDGWSEDMPLEVIDVIELRVQMARSEAVRRVYDENRNHKGGWLDEEVARKYSEAALIPLVSSGGQYIGRVRELGKDLQEKYGVTEIEAINILNDTENVEDYINKYYRIKNCIPSRIDEEAIRNQTLEELRLAV